MSHECATPFDFTIDLHTDQVRRVGHYSRAEDRLASREEVLLWNRVLELEQILDRGRPAAVRELLAQLDQVAETTSCVRVNATSFALLRTHASDRVKMLVHPASNQKRILGEVPTVVDGSPTTVWILIDRTVPPLTVLAGEL